MLPRPTTPAAEPATISTEWDAFAQSPLPGRKVLIVASICALYLSIFARVLWRVGDEGTIVYGAQRVARGEVPYRDFFEVMGPGSFYWLAGWFKVFGESWLALRVHLVLTGAALTALVYGLTLRLYRGRFEALPCVFLAVVGIPVWPASSHHWDANLFALAAVTSFVQWQRTRRSRWLSVTGGLAAMTTCVVQQKGALILIAAGLLLVLSRRLQGFAPTGRRLLHLAAGYVAVLILVALLFLRAGALGSLVYTTMIWPATQYHGVNRLPYGMNTLATPLSHLAQAFPSIPHGLALTIATIGVLPFVVIAVLPAIAVLLMLSAPRLHARGTLSGDSIPTAYLVFGSALYFSELQRPDIYHLLWGAPLLLVAVFGLTTRRLEENTRSIVLWAVSASLLVFAATSAIAALAARNVVMTRHGAVRATAPDPALQFVLDRVKPGAALFVYPYAPMYYYLADVRNPTRYSILMYQMNTPDQFADAIDGLERERVEYVLWDTVASGENFKRWFPTYSHPPDDQRLLEHYLMQHYDAIETANGFRILRRRR